jgi:hypothetical protein
MTHTSRLEEEMEAAPIIVRDAIAIEEEGS